MGERGRPPEPTAIRLLKGTAHKAINYQDPLANQPKQNMGSPECPEWLDETAAEEWVEIVTLMEDVPGWLSKVNKTTLAGHCHWYSVWVAAEKEMRETGRMYEVVDTILLDGTTSMVKKLNPNVRIAKEAWLAMIKCDQELGITPSRGSSVRVPEGERSDESGLDRPGRSA